jgi:hypothetical protein
MSDYIKARISLATITMSFHLAANANVFTGKEKRGGLGHPSLKTKTK